jgi:hypothetical protein
MIGTDQSGIGGTRQRQEPHRQAWEGLGSEAADHEVVGVGDRLDQDAADLFVMEHPFAGHRIGTDRTTALHHAHLQVAVLALDEDAVEEVHQGVFCSL